MREGRLTIGGMVAVWCSALACVAVLTGPASIAGAHGRPTRTRVLKGASIWFPESLDPQFAVYSDGWAEVYNTYIPLLTYRHAAGKAGSEVVPGLARGLPKLSDGGRTYTLFLRRGLRYSDGQRVKASDFKATIERLLRSKSEGAFDYLEIVGAEKFMETKRGGIPGIGTNDRTGKITIQLNWPENDFPEMLALPLAAPVPAGTPPRDLTADPPPATGPYAITRSDPGRSWAYARNPAWRRNGRLMPHLPGGHVDRVEMRVVNKPADRVGAIESGRLDWTSGWFSHAESTAVIRRYRGTQLRSEPTLNTYYFWMNTQKPPFDDVRVRQAVNYAVDRSVLRKFYGGEMNMTQQLLPPGMPGYRKFDPYPYDMAKARQLMAEADPSDRHITLWVINESEERRACAYYRDVLQELGFTVHLKVVKRSQYWTAINRPSRSNLDTGWARWFAEYPHPNALFEWQLSGWAILPNYNENFAQIDVPKLDALSVALESKRGAIPEAGYAALDRIYTELAPWVPYGNRTEQLFVSKAIDLEGVVWNPTFGADLTSFRFK